MARKPESSSHQTPQDNRSPAVCRLRGLQFRNECLELDGTQ